MLRLGGVAGRAIVALAPATTALFACLDTPSVEERVASRIVVTKFDPRADFASFTTFAIAEPVLLLSTTLDSGPPAQPLDPAIAGPMVDEIAALLSSRGYRRVAPSDSPDLGVAVTAVNQLRAETVSYGSWWGTGGTAAAFWGLPGAMLTVPFSYESTIAWQSGTLVIELYDVRGAAGRFSAPVDGGVAAPSAPALAEIWAGIIHGVLGPPGATIEAVPLDSIRQAFAQSPYLVAARRVELGGPQWR